MDFENYYLSQAFNKRGIPGFEGPRFQRGSGLGSVFRRFFKWIIPIIKTHAQPIIKSGLDTLQTEATEGLSKFTEDISEKNLPIKESAKSRFDESMSNIKKKYQAGGKTVRKGKIFKKKHKKLIKKIKKKLNLKRKNSFGNLRNKKTKRLRTIFD